ncbi:hypothetical protein CYMTET_36177 [Cymbomonas tetramitiformis]|uniref:J domain-containing protein n=1 Tax=Cymbomonas tetramitiformis TaxID=36881 RepID=A0AAE0CGG0_9CHLO|nr:hypothetical protein CYMTET_36177 [Cymbomonas tetramitiformis]
MASLTSWNTVKLHTGCRFSGTSNERMHLRAAAHSRKSIAQRCMFKPRRTGNNHSKKMLQVSASLPPLESDELPPLESEVGKEGPKKEEMADGRILNQDGWVVGYNSGYQKTSFGEDEEVESEGAKFLSKVANTHYSFLEVSPEADTEEIRESYRRLSKLYHPDTTKLEPEEAQKLFMRLQEANEILSDPREKAVYDMTVTLKAVQLQNAGSQRRNPLVHPSHDVLEIALGNSVGTWGRHNSS